MSENQRIRITKQLLKTSLIKLLKTKSINKISVTAICEDAQVNRTTFYKYYGSQYDLFNEMEQDVCEEIGTYLDKCSLASASAPLTFDALLAESIPYLTQMFTFIDEHFELCELLLSGNMSPDFPEKLIRSLNNMPEFTKAHLANIYSEADAAYVFDFLIGGCFAFVKKWTKEKCRRKPEEMAQLLAVVTASLGGLDLSEL